ncbi:hypothetical protein EVAR_49355_1 [Eumeta japonica]|uniref:Uncharacterized protein n=1 Tax=Eumeta variegata TaxID=151549 RepID=A0A4C1XU97_EUMVA|nr:hypothetical protein EVAR_49355_1 [Eumeta japonica]
MQPGTCRGRRGWGRWEGRAVTGRDFGGPSLAPRASVIGTPAVRITCSCQSAPNKYSVIAEIIANINAIALGARPPRRATSQLLSPRNFRQSIVDIKLSAQRGCLLSAN